MLPVCRLAPSPTGAQHLGNARTYLIAYWSARAIGAELILRIEDIDSPRVKPWASAQAIEDLTWLGIEYDGSPIIQTQRSSVYQSMLERMLADDRVYPCTCSRRDIEEASSAPHEQASWPLPQPDSSLDSADQTVSAEATIYSGTCRDWRFGDALPEPGSYSLRFRVTSEEMAFDDFVAGHVCCDPLTAIGDFPVTRKEGTAAYQLAVVVDDLESGVTEVVRGDDLLLSTFRQLQIYNYLGATPPLFAHVPLVVGTDGRRLAKRHGDTRLSLYREQGMRPETIVAWAARSAIQNSNALPDEAETQHWDLKRWHAEMIDRWDWSSVSREKISELPSLSL